jgi:hypothetical protein
MLIARMRRRRRLAAGSVIGTTMTLIIGTGMSVAFWTATGTGVASANAGTLGAPTGVSGSAASQTVTVSWTAGSIPSGATLSGYYVTRTTGVTTVNVCGSSPTSLLPVTPTNCLDTGVPVGTYTYRVVAVLNSWTATSTPSASVNVTADVTAPTMTLASTNATGAWLNLFSGTYRLYYDSDIAGTVRIAATVTDNGSGPASANFPADGVSGWTHPNETITSGTGSFPTITYTSTPWTWTVNPSVPTPKTITGRDVANNAVTQSVTFVDDDDAPTGGALTVNAVAATGGGSTSNNATGSFTIGTRTNFVEAQSTTQSGLDTSLSNLVRTEAPFTGGTCGTFTNATVITGSPAQGPLPTGCYRYVLTGVDRVGNSASLTTTVRVDTTAPINGALSANGTAATAGGTQSTNSTGAWPLTRTDWTDPDSGLSVASTLTRATAPLTPTGCGTFGATTTLTGTPAQTGLALGCYRYVLSATNGVGSVSSVTTTVRRISPPATVTGFDSDNWLFGTAGRIDALDTFDITYSEAVAPSSFCSAWPDSGDASLNANNQVTVTLSTAPSPDQLVVTSTACTFTLGTISLGTDAYSTIGDITYAGTGFFGRSEIGWDESSRTLSVRLGTASGTGATVPSSVITYTPSPSLLTIGGAAVTGSFATGNVQQF